MDKRVVLLGSGELAVRIGDWLLQRDDYDLVCVVPSVPEEPTSASLVRWSRVRGVPLVETGDCGDIAGVCGDRWQADIALSVGYPAVMNPSLVGTVGRCINLHNGPLPRYRGDSPINWALKNGERSHGVTVHEVTPVRNAGPIVGQVIFPIYPECDEVIDVTSRAIEYGYALLTQTLPILDRISPVRQDETRASGYTEEDRPALGDRQSSTRKRSPRNQRPAATSPVFRAARPTAAGSC